MPECHLLALALVHASADMTDTVGAELGLFVVVSDDVDHFEHTLTAAT